MHAAFTIHDLHHSGFNALFLLHSITARALQASRRQSPTAQSLHTAHSLHISRRQQYISLQYFSFHAGTDRYLVLDLFCCAHKQNGNHEGVPKTERARMSSNAAFNAVYKIFIFCSTRWRRYTQLHNAISTLVITPRRLKTIQFHSYTTYTLVIY